jgi:hypothetical protein
MMQVNGLVYNIRQNSFSIHEIRVKYGQQLDYLNNQTCWQSIEQSNTFQLYELSVDVYDLLLSFNDSLPLELDELQNSTRIIRDMTQSLNQNATHLQINVWAFLLVAILFIITPSIMIAGVCVVWFDVDSPKLRRFISWIVLPVFVTQVICAYTISSGLIIIASANSDFCSGTSFHSPDSTIIEILSKLGFREGEFIIKIVGSYFQQCSLFPDPLDFLRAFQDNIEILQGIIDEWNLGLVKVEVLEFGEQCNQQMRRAFSITHVLQGRINELLNNTRSVLNDLRCERLAHLYGSCVYVGLCDVSINGFIWAFACLSCISATGLILISYRSCWQLDELIHMDSEIIRSSSNRQLENYLNEQNDEYGGYTGYDENNDSLKDFLVSLETEETEKEINQEILLDETSSSK